MPITDPIDLKQIGENIRNRRNELGYTQRDLAKLVSSYVCQVHHWEHGRTDIKIQTLGLLAYSLETTPDALLSQSYLGDT